VADYVFEKFGVRIPEGSQSHRIEAALTVPTERMNHHPLVVNHATWLRNRDKKAGEVAGLVQKCREATGVPNFRPNAREDCISYFTSQNMISGRRTPNGAPVMDKEVLIDFANQGDPVALTVVDAREHMSQLSQLESWEKYARAGQVQATWDQFGTPMARYTAADPNLQNRITEIRETIEARPGFTLMSWDLGAAEYVTWASLSKDPVLSEIFNSGRDMHTEMAIFLKESVPTLDFRGEPRAMGKMVNFALCYLMNDWSLSKRLGCSGAVASQIVAAYKARAAKAIQYQTSVIEAAKSSGTVCTLYGRARQIPGLKSSNPRVRDEAIKTTWHHKNAGTAAEILKIKQIRLLSALGKAKLYPGITECALQMHDEVILEVADAYVDQVREIGNEAFSRDIEGFLPFKIDNRSGHTWLEVSK